MNPLTEYAPSGEEGGSSIKHTDELHIKNGVHRAPFLMWYCKGRDSKPYAVRPVDESDGIGQGFVKRREGAARSASRRRIFCKTSPTGTKNRVLWVRFFLYSKCQKPSIYKAFSNLLKNPWISLKSFNTAFVTHTLHTACVQSFEKKRFCAYLCNRTAFLGWFSPFRAVTLYPLRPEYRASVPLSNVIESEL